MAELAVRRAPAVTVAEWLRPLPFAVRFVFHGDVAARAAAIPVWGCPFPEQPCRAVLKETRAALWMGPDEYLLLAPTGGPEPTAADGAATLFAALDASMSGLPHSLVDISHRQIALEVRGAHAATILRGACPLDLDLGEFPPGMCTRTVLAKADVVLWRTDEHTFHLEVWRSFTAYVTGVLGEIAAEFYPGTPNT